MGKPHGIQTMYDSRQTKVVEKKYNFGRLVQVIYCGVCYNT